MTQLVDGAPAASWGEAPRISFVVPAYNVEEYIVEAMSSILVQKPAPYEVIVIDDGSTDSTAQRLLRYQSNPLVRIVSRQNGGLGSARNLGLSLCTGDYVFFMDSDDLIPDFFMERVSCVLREHACPDMVLFGASSFTSDGTAAAPLPTFARTFSASFPAAGSLLRTLLEAECLHAAAWLYVSRVRLWVDNHISFPPGIHEDEAVLFPLVTSAQSAVVIEDQLYLYRIRPQSIMTSGPSMRNAQAALEITKRFLDGVRERKLRKDRDVDLWRWKGAYWASAYLRYSRTFASPVDWPTAMRAALTFRRVEVVKECFYSLLPRRLYNLLRAGVHAASGSPAS